MTSPKARVLGLDLSLRGPAMCYLSARWTPPSDDNFETQFIEVKDKHRGAERVELISHAIKEMCRHVEPTHVFVEEYSFSSRGAGLVGVHELGGVVKQDLWREFDLIVQPIPAASARKTLLGKLPSNAMMKAKKMKLKEHVDQQLSKMGFKFGTMDEADAFVIANHGLMLLGRPHIGV